MNEYAESDYPGADEGDSGATLELVKTRLRVLDGELQRVNSNGGVVMRIPLSAIDAVEFRSRFDPIAVVFVLMGGGLAAIAYYVSENNVLTTLLYVGAILLGGLGVFGAIGQYVIIHSADGETKIQCNDLSDEGAGFVKSLEMMLGEKGRDQRRL